MPFDSFLDTHMDMLALEILRAPLSPLVRRAASGLEFSSSLKVPHSIGQRRMEGVGCSEIVRLQMRFRLALTTLLCSTAGAKGLPFPPCRRLIGAAILDISGDTTAIIEVCIL